MIKTIITAPIPNTSSPLRRWKPENNQSIRGKMVDFGCKDGYKSMSVLVPYPHSGAHPKNLWWQE